MRGVVATWWLWNFFENENGGCVGREGGKKGLENGSLFTRHPSAMSSNGRSIMLLTMKLWNLLPY